MPEPKIPPRWAMRAAKELVYSVRGWQQYSPSTMVRKSEEWAEIISRESGHEETVKALEAFLELPLFAAHTKANNCLLCRTANNARSVLRKLKGE